MTTPVVRDFIRKALLDLKEHELREAIQALAPLINCEVIAASKKIEETLRSAALPTEGWRQSAALEIVRQAVIDICRSGDVSGVTTEKMMRLFPDIKTGYECVRS